MPTLPPPPPLPQVGKASNYILQQMRDEKKPVNVAQRQKLFGAKLPSYRAIA